MIGKAVRLGFGSLPSPLEPTPLFLASTASGESQFFAFLGPVRLPVFRGATSSKIDVVRFPSDWRSHRQWGSGLEKSEDDRIDCSNSSRSML